MSTQAIGGAVGHNPIEYHHPLHRVRRQRWQPNRIRRRYRQKNGACLQSNGSQKYRKETLPCKSLWTNIECNYPINVISFTSWSSISAYRKWPAKVSSVSWKKTLQFVMDGAVFFLLGLYMNRLQFYLEGKLLSGQCRKFTIFPPCVCCREQFVGHAQLPYRFPFLFQPIHIATNSFQMFPDKGFVRTTGLQVLPHCS